MEITERATEDAQKEDGNCKVWKHKLPDLQGLLAALSKIPPEPVSKTQGISERE